MITQYFGTSISDYGHYLKSISYDGTRFVGDSIRFDSLPFSPEYVTQNLPNGDINYQHHKSRKFGEFTVCAIAGSCKDDRPGSKSVFIINKIVDFAEMQRIIIETPCCKEIIDKMPFKINW